MVNEGMNVTPELISKDTLILPRCPFASKLQYVDSEGTGRALLCPPHLVVKALSYVQDDLVARCYRA